MTGSDTLQKLRQDLEAVLAVVREDLSSVRTGRAKPSLVEGVKVEAYGTMMELREVATISAPDPSLLTATPWDKSLIAAVEKAIRASGLGLNPNVDGDVVKIPIPMLTEERRKELVKLVAQKIESGRVMIRQTRTEIKDEIEKLKDEPGVSEDDVEKWLVEMQKMVDEYNAKVEELGKEKEAEVMKI